MYDEKLSSETCNTNEEFYTDQIWFIWIIFNIVSNSRRMLKIQKIIFNKVEIFRVLFKKDDRKDQ